MNKITIATHKNILLAAVCLCVVTVSQANRPSSYPFISGDTFRQISDHIIDETKTSFDPHSVKNGDIIFLKTEMAQAFFSSLHPQISKNYILITHNSDFSPIGLFSADHAPPNFNLEQYLDDPKIIVWFAQNIDRKHPKLKPIPIGIANSYCRHGNTETFKKAIQQKPSLEQRREDVYINLSCNKYMEERLRAREYFNTKSFCYQAAHKDFHHYLAEIKQFKFVLSPPGNGFDCHRTWEALLMDCIPIVKHSLLDPLYADLPIILVHKWEDINPAFLNAQLAAVQKKPLSLEKIYADYWINLIKSYQIPYQ